MSNKELLTIDELNNTIVEIVSGLKYIELGYKHPDRDSYLILRQPTGSEVLWATHLEKVALEKAVKAGLPLDDELPTELVEKFFSEEDQDQLELLDNKIKAYTKMVAKGIKGSAVYTNNVEKLEQLREESKTLLKKKDIAKQFSANFKALEDKYYALMSRCVLNINKEPIWESLEELNQESDLNYLEYLLYIEFIPFIAGNETKVLRYIARSGQWMNRFYAAKHAGVDLFSAKAEDLSADQLALLSWSVFYHDISQMAEEYRPDDGIIEDDDRLDAYIDQLSVRLKAERRSRKNKSGSRKAGDSKLNATDHDDVIVTASNRHYIPLHHDGSYSDPKLVTGRAEERGKETSYSESAAIREAKLRQKAQRRQRLKKREQR